MKCGVMMPDCRGTWTALVQEDTASWARPANTLASTQRYSLDRQSSVCCTGGYQLAYALGELSFCSQADLFTRNDVV